MSYFKAVAAAGMIVPMLLSVLSIASFTQDANAAKIDLHGEIVGELAFWPGPVGQFSNIQVLVAKDILHSTTEIVFGFDTPTISGENVFLTTTANVFNTHGFNSATLSPVTLNVCLASDDFGNCTQNVPVTIQFSSTGFGATSEGFPIHQFLHHVLLTQFSGASRFATATGTLNGQSLGQSDEAIIFKTQFLELSF